MEPQLHTPPLGNTCLISQLPLSYNWSHNVQMFSEYQICSAFILKGYFYQKYMVYYVNVQCSLV